MSIPQPIEPSEKAGIRSLPIEFWPESDRKAWMSVSRPSQRLKRGGAGSHMKAITLADLARRYSYFLDFMNRQGLFDPKKTAGGHVTPANVDTYLEELTARVGSVTVQGSIYKLRRACELIDPARDLSWLTDIEKDLALVMRPRSKTNRWVLTEVLVEAGLTLIAEAENSRRMSKLGQARQVRNGLMVAMLAMHPVRLKNFAALEIGRSLVEIKGSWWIVLSATETKEDRPDERRIDDLLQPALDRYLKKYRPFLAGADQSTTALWLSSNDESPMTYDGVARAVTETTRSTVGVAVSPHLFRTAIASSAAIYGGANPHLASAVLHHKDARVTEAHYNRASSISAGESLRSIIQGYIKD
ncbi:site-specific integrase [Bradyrhizobium sp. AUGA SZCCT0177]|uniref:site-specific integrase n=1 Tax=Bradyrhizobium sp. AUGA SZCCT0177 TaxID=2807665 RepID=UPI001BAB7823|nr:site-specific integrase [Bradyrhizobium sp. AUGA SZCCT0177]MBR1287728.1 site-specific integrase [Bradyrhizobium sp. AUGA SZCCT0177]